MAAVTETGCGALVTKSVGQIRAGLTRRYGPSLVLLEQYRAPENQEDAETLDLVRTGTDGSPHRSRARPTPEEHPHHAGLELWMACCGSQIVSRPASWSG